MEQLVAHAQAIYRASVRGVQADRLLAGRTLDDLLEGPASAFERVSVVGAGKAAMAMAGAMEPLLGERLDGGEVVVPHGYRATLPGTQRAPVRVEVVEARHPVPDAAGVAAAQRALERAKACADGDLLVVLISGGGSALWPAFVEGLSLDDARETFRLLLHSGADIHQVNTVRKHLSRIGGGQLAAAAAPATVLALVLSDVPGDDLSVIASGPTVGDPTTYVDAAEVLGRYGVWEHLPASVRAHLEAGLRGALPDTPAPYDVRLACSTTRLLGTNRDALQAALQEAARLGYTVRVEGSGQEGEARAVGEALARQALARRGEGPLCLLWGGETTVTVTGSGRGGRNQELALSAAITLGSRPLAAEAPLVVLSGGTDGIDGPTDAAGAWATPTTLATALGLGLDPAEALANNDAYPFFERVGALLRTGPTHTNVMDLQVVLIGD